MHSGSIDSSISARQLRLETILIQFLAIVANFNQITKECLKISF